MTRRSTFTRCLGAERQDLLLFEHPQQSGLQGQRHVADLIEEQSTARGLQNLAFHSLLTRASERAGAVAEQLALDQRFRNRRAVQRDELMGGAIACGMQSAGEHLLAGARRALDHDRNARHGDAMRAAYVSQHLRIFSRQLLERQRGLAARGRRELHHALRLRGCDARLGNARRRVPWSRLAKKRRPSSGVAHRPQRRAGRERNGSISSSCAHCRRSRRFVCRSDRRDSAPAAAARRFRRPR